MPESWNPADRGNGGDKVTMPISKAGSVIRSLQPGTNIKCSNGLIIAREFGQRYKLYVPASRQGGGDIYLDRELHELLDGEIWEKQSDKMVSHVQAERIDAVLALMGIKHPGTVPVARNMLPGDEASSSSTTANHHYPIRMPAAPEEPTETKPPASPEIRLRALALELEMEMEMELEAA